MTSLYSRNSGQMADCASCRLFSLCNYELWVNTAENIMVGVDFPLSVSGFQGLPVLMPLSSRVQMGFLNCDHAGWGGWWRRESENTLCYFWKNTVQRWKSHVLERHKEKNREEEKERSPIAAYPCKMKLFVAIDAVGLHTCYYSDRCCSLFVFE